MNMLTPNLQSDPVVPEPARLSAKIVLRDVLMIWAITFAGGFIIGFTLGLFQIPDKQAFRVAGALLNFVLGAVGFTISGCLTPAGRWKHLLLVASLVWVTSLINMLLGSTFLQWIFAGIAIALMMLLGGGLSYVFNREAT